MTAFEVHIDLGQKLQSIDANRFDDLLEEEKDWWLSEAQMRYIKQRISPKINSKREGNQQTVKRYDDLQALISSYTSNLFVQESNVVQTPLPNNYYEMLSSRTTSDFNCNSVVKVFDNGCYYLASIELNSSAAAATFYQDLLIIYNKNVTTFPGGVPTVTPHAITLFDITDTNFPNGFSSYEDSFVLGEYLANELNNNSEGLKVYWERFGRTFRKNSLIFVYECSTDINTVPSNIRFSVDGAISTSDTFVQVPRNSYVSNPSLNIIVNGGNRLVETEEIYEILSHSFFTTKETSPVITVHSNTVEVHHNNNFLPTRIKMNYYRVPKRFSLLNGITFEVAHGHHSEIVDIAVQLISAHTMNTNVQGLTSINQINE